MARYKSTYTGPQIDSGVARALPGGAIDQLRPNRNLLDNWDFRNPVNQRGQSSYSTNGYTIDGWRMDNSVSFGTLSIVAGGITLSHNSDGGVCELTHIFERQIVDQCVFSADIDGVIYSAPVTFGNMYIQFGSTGYLAISNTATKIGIRSMIPSTKVISRVKLELGSVSTLANDPPADHEAEKAKCKRYFNLWASEAARTAALLEVGAMRTTPALSTLDIGGATYYTASADL